MPISPSLSQNVAPRADSTVHYLCSFYDVLVDPEEMKLELIPLRETGMHWNVLKFLEQGPCTTCVKLTGMVPSGNGTVLVDVIVKHPFSNPNFTGFDVRGIVMFNGSRYFPGAELNSSDRSLGDGELVNADGYTTLYNPDTLGSGPGGLQGYLKGKFASATYPNAHLNGYKRHISPGAANTRNAFYAGDSILETYGIAMPSGPFIFGYAVDASWARPVSKPVDDPMTDSGPEANCREPGKTEPFACPIGEALERRRLFSGKATARLMTKCRDHTRYESENREWGQIDVEAINDYLSGIICHYSDGIVVGLGEYEDAVSLNRYGRRFPVIIISSTGDGNLADLLYYQYYGLSGNRDLRSLYFDGCLCIHSGGSIYDIRANEIIYLDPAFGKPTHTQLNRTVSDITSYELVEMYDSAGYATLGIQLHGFRFFRGAFNALDEGLKWTDHEALIQFRVLGFDLNGDNERCLVIDEPHWETRFYSYCSATDSWIRIMTLPGIGYPEEWSVRIEKACFCEDESCLEQYVQLAF